MHNVVRIQGLPYLEIFVAVFFFYSTGKTRVFSFHFSRRQEKKREKNRFAMVTELGNQSIVNCQHFKCSGRGLILPFGELSSLT